MSETVTQLPAAVRGFLSDVLPATQGSAGAGLGPSGVTRGVSLAQALSANGMLYAGSPTYGVKADNTTNDTSAWAVVMAAAVSLGGIVAVVAPYGISIATIVVPANVVLLSLQRGASQIASPSAVTPAITLSVGSQLLGLKVVGNAAQPCVQASTTAIVARDLELSGGSSGINFSSLGAGSDVIDCRIHDCGIGIASPSEVGILNTRVTRSGTIGISIITGCNKNRIVGGRIEFSGTSNIAIDGTGGVAPFGNVVSGTSLDAAGGNNLLVRSTRSCTISGIDLGRAGRSQAGTPGSIGDANFYIQSSVGVVFAGNSSWTGRDDGGSGYNGPFYAVYDDGSNQNCIIMGNVLPFHNNSGSPTVGPINSTATFNLAAALNQTFWS